MITRWLELYFSRLFPEERVDVNRDLKRGLYRILIGSKLYGLVEIKNEFLDSCSSFEALAYLLDTRHSDIKMIVNMQRGRLYLLITTTGYELRPYFITYNN